MQRLKIVQRELKSFISDVRDVRGVQPNEVKALAKIREALALVQEAELYMAQSPALPDIIARSLKRLLAERVLAETENDT